METSISSRSSREDAEKPATQTLFSKHLKAPGCVHGAAGADINQVAQTQPHMLAK